MGGINWGSVPDWLAGGGAVFALLFAAAAVRTARATNEQQTKQIAALQRAEEARVEERRSQYASRLASWITLSEDDEQGHRSPAPAVALVNSNETPMYRVRVYAGTSLGVTFAMYNFVGPLSGRRIMDRPTRAIRKMLPEGENSALLDSGALWTALTFRDPAGRWWCRSPSGELHGCDDEHQAEDQCREFIALINIKSQTQQNLPATLRPS